MGTLNGDLPAFSRLRIDAGTCIPSAVCVSGRTGITREARNCLPCGFDEFVRVIGLINVAECESKTDRTSQRLNTNENVSEELRENTTDECQRNTVTLENLIASISEKNPGVSPYMIQHVANLLGDEMIKSWKDCCWSCGLTSH